MAIFCLNEIYFLFLISFCQRQKTNEQRSTSIRHANYFYASSVRFHIFSLQIHQINWRGKTSERTPRQLQSILGVMINRSQWFRCLDRILSCVYSDGAHVEIAHHSTHPRIMSLLRDVCPCITGWITVLLRVVLSKYKAQCWLFYGSFETGTRNVNI